MTRASIQCRLPRIYKRLSSRSQNNNNPIFCSRNLNLLFSSRSSPSDVRLSDSSSPSSSHSRDLEFALSRYDSISDPLCRSRDPIDGEHTTCSHFRSRSQLPLTVSTLALAIYPLSTSSPLGRSHYNAPSIHWGLHRTLSHSTEVINKRDR